MSHIYFIHKEDIENYESFEKGSKPLKEESNRISDLREITDDELQSRHQENNKKYDVLREKYPYRIITLFDKNYSNARQLGYVGYYRGCRWDE